MLIKTVTTWTAQISEEKKVPTKAKLDQFVADKKTYGSVVYETATAVSESIPTVFPYTSTRVWATKEDAEAWSAWLNDNFPDTQSTKIIS